MWPKGRKRSMDSRLKVSAALTGIIRSAETRAKMAEAKRGELNPQFGRPSWNAGLKGYLAGERHYRWNGGQRLHYPYVEITNPDEGYQYVYEHRLIVEQVIGRKLGSDEVVHHINGDPQDNRLCNLYLFFNKEHSRYHGLREKPLLASNISEDDLCSYIS